MKRTMLTALAAAAALTGCGSSASSGQAAPPAAGAAPTAAAGVDYGQQYQAALAPSAVLIKQLAQPGVTATAPQLQQLADAFTTAAQTLTAETWPPNADADVHAFASDLVQAAKELTANTGSTSSDPVSKVGADDQQVRSDLGLPASG